MRGVLALRLIDSAIIRHEQALARLRVMRDRRLALDARDAAILADLDRGVCRKELARKYGMNLPSIAAVLLKFNRSARRARYTLRQKIQSAERTRVSASGDASRLPQTVAAGRRARIPNTPGTAPTIREPA